MQEIHFNQCQTSKAYGTDIGHSSWWVLPSLVLYMCACISRDAKVGKHRWGSFSP